VIEERPFEESYISHISQKPSGKLYYGDPTPVETQE